MGVPVLSQREDIANARLRFENGCVANITVSRISRRRCGRSAFSKRRYLSLDYQPQEGFMYRLARARGKRRAHCCKRFARG